ncbi:MAG: acetyl-CoA carboxylase biotin carboxyl carrier protein [Endomicrobiales bacterium]|nr:acetyl-CoA carboxylase biotin carboxyl carrier protein [Endomicrobiales bacterium]
MKPQGNTSEENALKKRVKDLYEMMCAERLEELEIKEDEFYLYIKRKGKNSPLPIQHHTLHVPPVHVSGQPQNAGQTREELNGETVKSPITGVFYRSPSPSSPPFVKEGDVVDAGRTLCIIEAMKVMNEIKAETRCRIAKILVENGKPVNAEQDLFLIEKA